MLTTIRQTGSSSRIEDAYVKFPRLARREIEGCVLRRCNGPGLFYVDKRVVTRGRFGRLLCSGSGASIMWWRAGSTLTILLY